MSWVPVFEQKEKIIILGLCICYDNHNYGTMLQAYANVVAIENMGIPYEIIRYRKKPTPVFVAKSLPRLLNPILLHEKKMVVQKKLYLQYNKAFAADSAVKDAAFRRFKAKYFTSFSPVFYGYGELVRQAADRYGACLVGSDQLWSPSGLPTNFYNLKFVADNIPKISYAASFGVSSIPFFQTGRTREFLMRIEHLSVRENSARDIVRALTGREAKVVADPTMLLTREQWAEKIAVRRPREEPYIFAYFLGENPEHRALVKELAARTGMTLVALRHMDQFVTADRDFGDEAPFDVGPKEFLNLIRHAACICTDSFHGMVFSILHHKQFIVFPRYRETAGAGNGNSRNSRITSICANLGITERRHDPSKPLLEQIQSPIAYDQVDDRINLLREESLQYLQESLSCLSGS